MNLQTLRSKLMAYRPLTGGVGAGMSLETIGDLLSPCNMDFSTFFEEMSLCPNYEKFYWLDHIPDEFQEFFEMAESIPEDMCRDLIWNVKCIFNIFDEDSGNRLQYSVHHLFRAILEATRLKMMNDQNMPDLLQSYSNAGFGFFLDINTIPMTVQHVKVIISQMDNNLSMLAASEEYTNAVAIVQGLWSNAGNIDVNDIKEEFEAVLQTCSMHENLQSMNLHFVFGTIVSNPLLDIREEKLALHSLHVELTRFPGFVLVPQLMVWAMDLENIHRIETSRKAARETETELHARLKKTEHGFQRAARLAFAKAQEVKRLEMTLQMYVVTGAGAAGGSGPAGRRSRAEVLGEGSMQVVPQAGAASSEDQEPSASGSGGQGEEENSGPVRRTGMAREARRWNPYATENMA